VVEINAEKFEKQGDWRKAIAEYRVLRSANRGCRDSQPDRQIILTLPATATSNDEARKEFEQELKVTRKTPEAEYFLGELPARRHLPQAIEIIQTRQANAVSGAVLRLAGVCSIPTARPTRGAAPNGRKTGTRQSDEHLPSPTPTRIWTQEDAAREFALQKHRREDPAQHRDGGSETSRAYRLRIAAASESALLTAGARPPWPLAQYAIHRPAALLDITTARRFPHHHKICRREYFVTPMAGGVAIFDYTRRQNGHFFTNREVAGDKKSAPAS